MQLQNNNQLEFPEKSGIYAIINTINEKHYIGSAINFKIRHRLHFNTLKRNEHKNQKLQNSWNKNWPFHFIFVILEYCEKEKLIEREQWWIDRLQPEYNIAKVGSVLGHKHNDITRAKMRANFNRSEKTKKRRSQSKLGKKQTPEHIAKMIAGKKGFKHSEQTKQRMSEAAKKRGIQESLRIGHKKYFENKYKLELDTKCLIQF
jgi:group I intron endonuclease